VRDRRTVHGDEGSARRLLDDPGEFEGRAPSRGAKRCPALGNEIIEIRQVQEMEDFSPEIRKATGG